MPMATITNKPTTELRPAAASFTAPSALGAGLPTPPRALALFAPLASGVLLWLCYFPAAWCAFEFLRAHLAGGFPWYFLAHTQHALLPMIQISDVTGAYGVSFLVAAVNVLVFEVLVSRPQIRSLFSLAPHAFSARSLAIQAIVVLFGLSGTLTYGYWRLSQQDFRTGPRIALIQGNL